MTMISTRRQVLSLVLGGVAAVVSQRPALAGDAAAVDPAALAVQDFYDALLDAMRHANEIKMQGRYDKLYPVMTRIFDVPTMTRMAVGPEFAKLAPAEQAAVRDAFGKLLAATFASTFDDFKGERFSIDGDVATQGSDRLVKTQLHATGAPVDLNYLLRGKGDDWKVIDIYLNGNVSQLATWRSEYGSLVIKAGFPGVMGAVQKQTAKYMSSF